MTGTSLLAPMASTALALAMLAPASPAEEPVVVPQVVGDWWTIATSPDLGPLGTPEQQPVDFSIWQAADGTWQLWSCVRGTRCGGTGRLLYGWEGARLTDPDWRPIGIAMEAEPALGETPGGLQAPHVIRVDGLYHMFYGDWEHICLATSADGKHFTRVVRPEGVTGLFTEGLGANTRDAMVLRVGERWHCYYTAFPGQKGAVYCRTSTDLRSWSDSTKVASGGRAGDGICSAECPHVVLHEPSGCYYLFRTQVYGEGAQTLVYRSPDPLNFGIDDDRTLVCALPVAAPEIILDGDAMYLACLLPSLKGIRLARLEWRP